MSATESQRKFIKIGSSEAIVADTSNTDESSVTQMFKLNVDCFELLFELLSLKELLTFRRTCKRMKAVVDYYIKLNYPKLLHLSISDREQFLEFCNTRLPYFEWIKHLSIWHIKLTGAQIYSIKYVLSQLETLELQEVEFDGDFYEVVLKYCPRLKYLGVRTETAPDWIIGTRHNWLLRRYPTLEQIAIESWTSDMDDEPIRYTTELLTFFQQNPNIRIFSTDSSFLSMCHQFMLGSNIKFDRLDIFVNHDLNFVCNLANDFSKYDFYKRLRLYSNEEMSFRDNQLLSEFRNLEKLHFSSLPEGNPIPKVESVKELSILALELLQLDSPESITTNFTNLKRIEMQYAHLRDIQPFICHSPKLEEIKIWKLEVDSPMEPKISDFDALNEEREKLGQSQKIKIFIDEQHYLKLKFAGKMNWSRIEVKRVDSCEVEILFNWLQE